MNSQARLIRLAYADLVAQVFLWLRNGLITDRKQFHDLGDALHNISTLLSGEGGWIDDSQYRVLYLQPYDATWATAGLSLENFLDERLKFHSAQP